MSSMRLELMTFGSLEFHIRSHAGTYLLGISFCVWKRHTLGETDETNALTN